MDSKKINQLATNVAPSVNDLTVVGDATTGELKKITLSQISSLFGSSGSVSSVAMTTPIGLSISGSPITTSGTLAVTFTAGYSIPTTTKQSEWDLGYAERLKWDGGSAGLVASTARASLGLVIGTDVLAYRTFGSAANNATADFATFAQGVSADTAFSLRLTGASLPLSISGNIISIAESSTTISGFLSSTNFNVFNGKQAALNGTGFVKASGTTISYDNSTYALDNAVVHLIGTETIGGTKTFSDTIKNNGGIFLQNASSNSLAGYMNLGGLTNGIRFTSGGGIANYFTLPSATGYTYTFPNASGTIALVGGSGVGTVTSVAALTIGTSGTDLSSTVATSTTTPVITLNVPTASATNRGALSSADWTTFNNKQSALTNPVTGTGTTNYLPKFTGASTIGNSAITDDGTTVTYGSGSGLKQIYINGGGYDLILGASGGGIFGFTSTNISLVFSTTAKPLGIGTNAAQPLIFGTSATERMRLDASGNLGLGVTPSAWAVKAIDISTTGAVFGDGIAFDYTAGISQNCYRSGNTTWNYKLTGVGTSRFELNSNIFSWYQAPSGTAGNAITFTQAMTLTASGRLLINKTNEETYQLDVNGTGRFTGDVTIKNTSTSANLFIDAAATGGSEAGLYFKNGGTNKWENYTANNDTALNWYSYANSTIVFKLASTGAATFSSSITSGTNINSGDSVTLLGELYWGGSTSGQKTRAYTIGASGSATLNYAFWNGTTWNVKSTLDYTGAATFSSTCTATGFFESSDSRLKTLIQDNYQTKGIASITPKLYTKNGKVELGYYAQDLVGILDSAISKSSDDMLSLSYREVLVAKVYALEQRIKELETK